MNAFAVSYSFISSAVSAITSKSLIDGLWMAMEFWKFIGQVVKIFGHTITKNLSQMLETVVVVNLKHPSN